MKECPAMIACEMALYDELPPPLRAAIRGTHFKWGSSEALDRIKEGSCPEELAVYLKSMDTVERRASTRRVYGLDHPQAFG